jgi:hypothetical protein
MIAIETSCFSRFQELNMMQTYILDENGNGYLVSSVELHPFYKGPRFETMVFRVKNHTNINYEGMPAFTQRHYTLLDSKRWHKHVVNIFLSKEQNDE